MKEPTSADNTLAIGPFGCSADPPRTSPQADSAAQQIIAGIRGCEQGSNDPVDINGIIQAAMDEAVKPYVAALEEWRNIIEWHTPDCDKNYGNISCNCGMSVHEQKFFALLAKHGGSEDVSP